MKNAAATKKMGFIFVLLVVLLLVGLPIAVWLDLRSLANSDLRRQASDVNSIISSVRSYYANNVVGRILAAPPGTATQVVHNYEDIPRRDPHSRNAFARTRPSHRRAAAQHRVTVSCPTIRSPIVRRIRSINSSQTALRRFARIQIRCLDLDPSSAIR